MKNFRNYLINISFDENTNVSRDGIEFYGVVCIYNPMPSFLSLFIKQKIVSLTSTEQNLKNEIKTLENTLLSKDIENYQENLKELSLKIKNLSYIQYTNISCIVYDFVSFYYDKEGKSITFEGFLDMVDDKNLNAIFSILLNQINREFEIVSRLSNYKNSSETVKKKLKIL